MPSHQNNGVIGRGAVGVRARVFSEFGGLCGAEMGVPYQEILLLPSFVGRCDINNRNVIAFIVLPRYQQQVYALSLWTQQRIADTSPHPPDVPPNSELELRLGGTHQGSPPCERRA